MSPLGVVPKMNLPRTLGELRKSHFTEEILRKRRVKDEMRDNLVAKLRKGGPLFPGSWATTIPLSLKS